MRSALLRSLCVLSLLAASSARAVPSVSLLFEAVDGAPIAPTDTVTVAPGQILDMAVFLTTDAPITAAVFSLNYDLDADNELDVISALQWDGVQIPPGTTNFFQPLVPLDPVTPTFIGSFQG